MRLSTHKGFRKNKIARSIGKKTRQSYLATDRTEPGVNLHVDSEFPLSFLLVLGLQVDPLHLGVDDLDVVELEGGIAAGDRAHRDRVEKVHVDTAGRSSNCPRYGASLGASFL